MASLYKNVVNGKPYWYQREMARVDGKPKMVSERYLGQAADIEALLEAREAAVMPERTRHLGFGDVAAVWGVLQRLDVAGIIDGVIGPRRADAGTYLALAALNRVVAPRSKLAFADWWRTTAADRFTRIPASALRTPDKEPELLRCQGRCLAWLPCRGMWSGPGEDVRGVDRRHRRPASQAAPVN